MDICNCHKDLNAYLCFIPFVWRKSIVNALCSLLEPKKKSCLPIKNCETLTELLPFTLIGNNLSIEYKDEYGYINKLTIDVTQGLNNLLTDVDSSCIMPQSAWNALTFDEKLQKLIDEHCFCCPTTTTTSTTTTSSTTTTTTINPSFCMGYHPTDCQLACWDACGATTSTTSTTSTTTVPPIIYEHCMGYDVDNCELACVDYENCLIITTTTTSTTTTTVEPTTTTTTTTTTEEPTTSTTSTTTSPSGNNIFIQNLNGGGSITNVEPFFYVVDSGTYPLNTGESINGFHGDYTGIIDVTVTGTNDRLTLYINGVPIQCISVTGAGIYTFSSQVYLTADTILITMENGSNCP